MTLPRTASWVSVLSPLEVTDSVADYPELPLDRLSEYFGEIDVYLFDQLLRGRIRGDMDVLDAGCGAGRNLVYLLRSGVRVHAIDSKKSAVASVRALAARLAPSLPPENFQVSDLEALPHQSSTFDAVISSAVLHFAANSEIFHRMVDEMWRVLRPGGLLFARLASSIGIEERIEPVSERRYLLPDGSTRFLVDERMLLDVTGRLDGTLVDPIKTTNVQGQRCMTTWCVAKTPLGRSRRA